MATADDERSPYDSGTDEERLCKRPFQPEVSTQQGGNLASNSITVGKSEVEQMLKQTTLTRPETQHLIELLHSRTIQESPTPLSRLEASTTKCSMERRKDGDERDNCHASFVSSRALEEEEIGSPAELAKAYKGSTSGTRLSKTLMASPQHPATMENLPDELLINIFIRLLAKQLAQMRSVSKSWNGLLSQSSFIKSHLHRSIHNNDQILLVLHCIDNFSYDSEHFTAYSCRSPSLELTNFIKLPVNPRPRPENTNGIRVIGSVNGLICSCYGDSIIQIWNPSLSAVLTLPPYSMPSVCYDSIKIFFRFGFDPTSCDYKVVKLAQLSRSQIWLQTEIYSMRKGTWELITKSFPSHITDIIVGDVCVDGLDGRFHWLGWIDVENDSERIVAFDLVSETFREIPLPHFTLDYEYDFTLGVLAGKLCVISWVKDDGTCDVWVMDEYGVAESWVKRHVFSQIIGFWYAFGFTSGNKLLIYDKNGCLVLYDPSANEQKILKDYLPKEYGVEKIVEYVDSLVWVAPAKREIVDGA